MATVKWVKIVTDIFDDEKILLIESMPDADSIIVIWFKLLCLAGKQNNSGVFMMNNRVAYTDAMLATIFRRKEATVSLALATFEQFGMIEIINDVITIPHWEKHQNIDGMDKIREDTRKRTAEYRKRKKLLLGGDVTVTQCDALEEEEEEEKNIRDMVHETSKPKKIFVKPTIEEVKAYCQERKNNVDAEKWLDYYTANGWKVGRNAMKDWKATVRNWEHNEKKEGKSNGAFSQYEQFK